jgi:hypothetical protein
LVLLVGGLGKIEKKLIKFFFKVRWHWRNLLAKLVILLSLTISYFSSW